MMRPWPILFLLALSACNGPPEDTACYVPHVSFNNTNFAAPAQMFVANDQRWCSIIFNSTVPGEAPYTSGAITKLPDHGVASINSSSKGVVFRYRPAPGFVGSDEFDVEYGNGRQKVLVTVRGPLGTPEKTATTGPVPPTPVAALAVPAAGTPALQPASSPIVLRCLPSGTEQTYSTGAVIRWLGSDPSSADLCIGRNKEGQPVQRVRGVWSIGGYWPDGIPAVREAFRRLAQDAPGTPVVFTETGKPPNSSDPRPSTWTHTLRVAGEEAITVPAGTFEAVVIEDTEEGVGGNTYRGVNHAWIDRSSGAVLRWDTMSISNGQHSSWETTALRLP